MNTRIRYQPQENITSEAMRYLLPQIVTLLIIGFVDSWVLISFTIFLITGAVFVRSKKIHLSLLFSMFYTVFRSGDKIIITTYSRDGMRSLLEYNQDGIEARELEPNIYLVH